MTTYNKYYKSKINSNPESKAMSKLVSDSDNSYTSDPFYNLGLSAGKRYRENKQAKAEAFGFDSYSSYSSAISKGKKVNRANKKEEKYQDRSLKSSDKKKTKVKK